MNFDREKEFKVKNLRGLLTLFFINFGYSYKPKEIHQIIILSLLFPGYSR